MKTVVLELEGMSCAACASAIERSLQAVPGVSSGAVNFGIEQATVTFDPDRTSVDGLVSAVTDAGYGAKPVDKSGDRVEEVRDGNAGGDRDFALRVIFGCAISALLIVGMTPAMLGLPTPALLHGLHDPRVQMILATPVQVWVGAEFYRGAWHAVHRKTADMNVLVVLGTTAAFGYSAAIALAGAWLPS
ncbi:MAG: cation transporter, partial [Cyanobacteria bacterium J06639_1]